MLLNKGLKGIPFLKGMPKKIQKTFDLTGSIEHTIAGGRKDQLMNRHAEVLRQC